MGCFDTVKVSCPNCGKENRIQSKAGDCLLDEYDLDIAPDVIKADLNGEFMTCNNEKCQAKFKIVTRVDCHVEFR